MTNSKKFAAACFTLTAILFIAGGIKYTPSIFDDAYNYMRYAKNFIAGHGQSYNIDEGTIYGLTSQLYFYYHTLIVWLLPFSEPILLELSSSLMGAAALLLILWTSYTATSSSQLKEKYTYFFLGILSLVLMNKPFVYHSFSGMDTTLSLLVNTGLIYCVLRYLSAPVVRNLVYVIVVAFLCVFTRPDNLFYATMFPFLAFLLRQKGSLRIKSLFIFSVGWALLIGIDLWTKQQMFGSFIPTTWQVKQHGFLEGYTLLDIWNSMEYFLIFLMVSSPFVVLLLLTCTKDVFSLMVAFFLPVIVTFSYYFSVFQVMGFEARYYFPAFGFVVIGSIISLDRFFTQDHSWKVSFLSPARLGLIFILFTVLSNGKVIHSKYAKVFLGEGKTYEAPSDYTLPLGESIGRTEWLYHYDNIHYLSKNLPEKCKVATTETGRLSAHAIQITLIDLIGFHNQNIADNGFVASNLMKKQPDFIFIHHVYSKMNRDLINDTYFRQQYDFYPDAFFGGIAIRKESPYFRQISSLIGEIWTKAYGDKPMEEYRAIYSN